MFAHVVSSYQPQERRFMYLFYQHMCQTYPDCEDQKQTPTEGAAMQLLHQYFTSGLHVSKTRGRAVARSHCCYLPGS